MSRLNTECSVDTKLNSCERTGFRVDGLAFWTNRYGKSWIVYFQGGHEVEDWKEAPVLPRGPCSKHPLGRPGRLNQSCLHIEVRDGLAMGWEGGRLRRGGGEVRVGRSNPVGNEVRRSASGKVRRRLPS